MNYAFRITSSYESLSKFVKDVSNVCERLAVYEHHEPDKRVHIHGYVEGLTVSTDTLKNWVKTTLNVKSFPKSDWEFAQKISKGEKKGQPVDRESLMYFHKGKNPILYNKGFSPELVEEQHKKSYIPKEYVGKSLKTQYKLVCENPTQKKHRENDLVKLMIDRVKPLEIKSDENIMREVIAVLNETLTVCGDYKCVDYFDTVIRRTMPHISLERCLGILAKRKPRD